MGIFNRHKKEAGQPAQQQSFEGNQQQPASFAATEPAAPAVEPLNSEGGLGQLVALMRAKGQGELALELKQTGNDMNLGFFENDAEKETTVVVPGSEWFDAVAAFYTDEEKSQRGAFNRALVKTGSAENSPVELSLLPSAGGESHNLVFASADAEKKDPVETTQGEKAETAENSAADSFSRIDSRLNSEEQKKTETEESFSEIAFGKKEDKEEEKPQYVTESDLPTAEEAIAARQAREAEQAPSLASPLTQPHAIHTVPVDDEHIELADNIESADFDEESAEDSHQLPDHIDDDFSEEPLTPSAASAGAGLAAPSSPAEKTETPLSVAGSADVPQNAEDYDVAPSYNKPAQPVAKPSTTAKAEGNLVLTEAEVVSRLAGAQEALFGPNGTARDVSTVLIRIRSLGSYYDALTHVRSGGFWDQKKTFELVPEDVLNVLQLKADSYQEGSGSPLAISLRFTPGIPPVARFDYSNEEAFVQYSDHLPAQQYVEELRMFPRTGSNIPDHMNQALTSWSF
ncbi:hypothetical protein [Rothia aerolata]|uniref:Uncharacterized protein n=1 Tax=Rothia aerolata TaxID=1812262 RepID=A0A917MTI8_9MICC|nr:hypothetical protein [Rothia aerolata]GGH62679.1 hypothetical protein GCM10007359_13180 [Rothia aerolata]